MNKKDKQCVETLFANYHDNGLILTFVYEKIMFYV